MLFCALIHSLTAELWHLKFRTHMPKHLKLLAPVLKWADLKLRTQLRPLSHLQISEEQTRLAKIVSGLETMSLNCMKTDNSIVVKCAKQGAVSDTSPHPSRLYLVHRSAWIVLKQESSTRGIRAKALTYSVRREKHLTQCLPHILTHFLDSTLPHRTLWKINLRKSKQDVNVGP